jgi:hypothetical protein
MLTAFFFIFAAIGLAFFLMGELPFYSLLIVVAFLAVIAALYRKGGNLTRVIAFIVSGIFIGFGLLFIALIISTFFNQEYDNITAVVLAILGLVGISTFSCLRKPLFI